jgi:hypothetical protein
MKRDKEIGMVDVAIAANFVRELTEEQFEERQRTPRRMARAGGRPAASRAAAGATVNRARVAARLPADASSRRGRLAGTRFGRALYRLAQVRG